MPATRTVVLAAGVSTNNFRQLIRKCPTLTPAVQTSPTAHPYLHDDDGALHGQVLKMPEIPAVPTCRLLAASGTGAHFRSRGRDHPVISVSLGAQNPYARPWSPICFASHARAYRRPCARSNQTVRKVRQTPFKSGGHYLSPPVGCAKTCSSTLRPPVSSIQTSRPFSR